MKLSELTGAMRRSSGAAEATVDETWLQGRSVFGGLQAVVALAAMRTLVPETTPLRTLQMTFVAPVPGGAVNARATLLRAGKSATQVEARLVDGDATLATAVAVFGLARDSAVQRALPAPRAFDRKPIRLPFKQNVTPNFMQHFAVELLDGALPFSGHPVHSAAYRLGLDDQAPVGEAHLLAFADFVPPVALAWSPSVVPGSSMTWMLEFFAHDVARHRLDGWQVESEMIAASEGYTSQSTILWAPDRTPVALSRQSMVVFA
ncbi:MAG TPA: thioesterase family protein [Rudaea sp.]